MQDIPIETIKLAAKENMEAFEKIYKISSGFVYSIAYRISGNKDVAQDITQEVFLKIYKNLKKFQFRSSFKTWIYRITANTAINASKKYSKTIQKRVDFDEAAKFKAAPDLTLREIYKNDSKQILKNLLQKLKPNQRVCIILREIEGLNYKEIAWALKTNINTVRSRLKRARVALIDLRKNGVMTNEL